MKFIALITMLLVVGCTFPNERHKKLTSQPDEFTNVSVFGCDIQIPSEYHLITSENSGFRFSKQDTGTGSITIRPYDSSIESTNSKDIEIVSKKNAGKLIIMFLKVAPGYKKATNDVVVIHDNNQAITIMGDDIDIWRDFISQCDSSLRK